MKDNLKVDKKSPFAGGDYFARILIHAITFNKLNRIYKKIGDKKGLEFIDELILSLGLNIELDAEEVKKRIPKTGPVITISNHPLGGLDALLLIKTISLVRNDIQVISTPVLQKIEAISDFFIEDRFFERHTGKRNTDYAMNHLAKGGVLCIFPAGQVSEYDFTCKISDKQWSYPALKFIKQQRVPVIPIHFQGYNSRLFYLMGRIHPSLSSVKLPSEMLNKRKKHLKIRVGVPVLPEEQEKFPDIYQFGRYLRAKTYCLSSSIEVKRFFNYSLKPQQKIEPVASPVSLDLILKEIADLGPDNLLFTLKNYTVYCAPSKRIPNILNEIGRLREITFRAVGEGTNRSIDLDEFDLYYNQMFIWDNETNMIVGAYRIGKGADILRKYGMHGFYIQSLFKMKEDFESVLSQSLELGRSFVVQEYQRKPMPLFLLWKGILYFLLKNPEYRYLLGPVSISNNYSKTSKDMIIKFIMAHHFNWDLARFVTPRNAYKFKSTDQSLNVLMENMDEDINALDKFIGDVDELNSGLPVLLKKYIKLNAKIIGFNVDPLFNNCLDGMIILDLYDVPTATIESLSKEVNDGSILQRFYSNRE